MLAAHEGAAALGIEEHLLRNCRPTASASPRRVPSASTASSASAPRRGWMVPMSATGTPSRRSCVGIQPGLAVSRPVQAPVQNWASRRWSVLVTRPLRDAEGRIQGAGSVLLDPVALGADLATQMPQPGRVAILRGLPDGTDLVQPGGRDRPGPHPGARPPADPGGPRRTGRNRRVPPCPGRPAGAGGLARPARPAGRRRRGDRCRGRTGRGCGATGSRSSPGPACWRPSPSALPWHSAPGRNRSRNGPAWPRPWRSSGATSWPCWCTRSAPR